MSFAIKTISYQQHLMLNICDAELVGRTIKRKDGDMTISKNYFAERFVEKKEAEELLKKYSIINLVGKETNSLSINLGIGSSNGIKEFDGVPFQIVFKF